MDVDVWRASSELHGLGQWRVSKKLDATPGSETPPPIGLQRVFQDTNTPSFLIFLCWT